MATENVTNMHEICRLFLSCISSNIVGFYTSCNNRPKCKALVSAPYVICSLSTLWVSTYVINQPAISSIHCKLYAYVYVRQFNTVMLILLKFIYAQCQIADGRRNCFLPSTQTISPAVSKPSIQFRICLVMVLLTTDNLSRKTL
jgi:hypothetical protein